MKTIIAIILMVLLCACLIGCEKMDLIFNRSDKFIITFNQDIKISQGIDKLKSFGIKAKKKLTIINGISCNLDIEDKQIIESLAFVRYIEPDIQLYRLERKSFELLMTKNNFNHILEGENIDWGVKRIDAPEVWNTATGKDVNVAVMDTGINTRHPDLIGAVIGGYDAINDKSYEDDNNHGTYVASVISARKNGIGIIGVAPSANLYAIKVMDKEGRGYISDILDGCQWAMKEKIKIINMSFGSSYQSLAIKEAMDKMASEKIIIISASGNDGKFGVYSPAKDNVTVCVGGSDINDKRASWSNYGPELKENGVLAPGDWIQVADKDGKEFLEQVWRLRM
ncbi:MAG: S8 family serine peptidase [Candidatus Poribacteria bacterium]